MISALSPRHLLRTAVDLELRGARALESVALTDDHSLMWAEHANRLHVFSLFQYADLSLGATSGSSLADLVGRTWAFSPFDRVWVTEGVGYHWGGRLGGALPECSLVPLHSGVGLSIAHRHLKEPAFRRHRDLVPALIEACAACAMPGMEQVAIETIGLVVRNMYPQLVRHFDDVLSSSDGVLHACFWHGMGRGAYFATSNWRSASGPATGELESLRTSVPMGPARDNAVAGFAWAATLVNLQAPQVLARYLLALRDDGEAAAFASGVASSLIVWQHTAPDDDGIANLLACDGSGDCGELWDDLVLDAAEEALSRYPSLSASGRVQDVFHHEAV